MGRLFLYFNTKIKPFLSRLRVVLGKEHYAILIHAYLGPILALCNNSIRWNALKVIPSFAKVIILSLLLIEVCHPYRAELWNRFGRQPTLYEL